MINENSPHQIRGYRQLYQNIFKISDFDFEKGLGDFSLAKTKS